MSHLERYIDQFGPVVGPRIVHLEKSRAAYKGVSTRRRLQIADLTGKPVRKRTRRALAPTPLFPEMADASHPEAS